MFRDWLQISPSESPFSPCIMSVQYTGGVQCNGGCSVHRGDIIEYTGGIQDTRGYHEYTCGCSVHQGFYTNSIVFPITFPTFIMISPSVLMVSPQRTEHPHCTHDIPHCIHDIPGVLHIPLCTAKTLCRMILDLKLI